MVRNVNGHENRVDGFGVLMRWREARPHGCFPPASRCLSRVKNKCCEDHIVGKWLRAGTVLLKYGNAVDLSYSELYFLCTVVLFLKQPKFCMDSD